MRPPQAESFGGYSARLAAVETHNVDARTSLIPLFLRFSSCPSRVNRGNLVNPSHMNLLLTLAGLGDVVRGLHPHERVHLHPKGFLNAERHIPGKVSLAV